MFTSFHWYRTHCAYPQRVGQVELTWVAGLLARRWLPIPVPIDLQDSLYWWSWCVTWNICVEIVAAVGAKTCWTEEGETWFVLGAQKGAASGEWDSAKRDRKTDEGTKVSIVQYQLHFSSFLSMGGSVVEHWSLHWTCSWWVTIYMGKPSAVGQLTRPTQPFILMGSINE